MGILDSVASTAAETLASKTVGALGDKISKSWNAYKEYNRKLEALKTFASHLLGLTEEAAKTKTQEAGLMFRVVRRNRNDYSFNGRIERRYDRIMVEVDHDEITKAYLA